MACETNCFVEFCSVSYVVIGKSWPYSENQSKSSRTCALPNSHSNFDEIPNNSNLFSLICFIYIALIYGTWADWPIHAFTVHECVCHRSHLKYPPNLQVQKPKQIEGELQLGISEAEPSSYFWCSDSTVFSLTSRSLILGYSGSTDRFRHVAIYDIIHRHIMCIYMIIM